MTVQSEHQLENELIQQLQGLEYAAVTIKDESQLLSNLKIQIERANDLAPLKTSEISFLLSLMMAQAGTSSSYPMIQVKTCIKSPIKSLWIIGTLMGEPAALTSPYWSMACHWCRLN